MAKVKSKKYKAKLESNKKGEREKNKNEGSFNGKSFNVKSLSYVILLGIFLFSFYIRGITPIKSVFRNGIVAFAGDDAVFHMRLVENTIHFFPHRIVFDAFTQYPNGDLLHWGPLFDQMIAFISLAAGLITGGGMPSQSMIDTIGAFFPAVLGALIVFPVYFIGKEIMDEKAGLIGAFLIAILPGQFLSRSLLGFTDNHVAEVFYLSLMMMFFIMAIKKAENITFDHWLNRDWTALKVPMTYTFLAGISYGAYLLNWAHGVFFGAVFGIFIIIQYIIDHFRGRSTEYLGVVGTVAYLVAMIMVMPYIEIANKFNPAHYSFLHAAVTGGLAFVFVFFSLISREMNRREYNGAHFLLFILGILLVGIILIKALIPGLYDATAGNLNYVFRGNTGGALTVAEAKQISTADALRDFGYNYYFAYIAILVLGYYVIKRSKAEYTLVAVWSIFVLAIMWAQNRFAYYYAVNVAILIGFLSSNILNFSGWNGFDSDDVIKNLKNFKVRHPVSLILVIALIGFLPVDASPYMFSTQRAPIGVAGAGYFEWYQALTWMKDNTPVPDLPYYSIYERPPQGQPYNYSINDYGVMSWWDYGHVITYFGHRIPHANPFQAGIGGGADHRPGAATFLIAPTEEEANRILDELGINGKPVARYVLSNAYMAYDIFPVFVQWDLRDPGEYYVRVQTSQGLMTVPNMKYFNSMEARLHVFDTNGLHNYRLVHESTPSPITPGGNEEISDKSVYNILYGGNLKLEYTGYVKIFEYVKGAKITGRAPPNTTVTLTNTINTNIGRTIPYSQTTSSDGTYTFTVPYSTLGPIPGETQFDTGPAGPYTVTAGNFSKQVDVNEEDVLEGRTVFLDLT